MSLAAAATVRVGSYTPGFETPEKLDVAVEATTVSVSVLPPVIRNSLWMSPFAALSAGTPPVATTVAVPPVRVTTSVLLAACVGLTSALLIVDELV
jgi:hypothetical protein